MSHRPVLPPKSLPTFAGRVFERAEMAAEEYKQYAYQYAFTSQPSGSMWPAAIIYAADESDVRKAIEYASENGLGLAVRSGGHQYLGVSSTSGDNVLLDMSGRLFGSREAYPFKKVEYDESTRLLTMGAGTNLEEVMKVTTQLGVFFPHGECCEVHTGGHTQTGGLANITRSFGMLVDHLHSFEIFLASGEKRTVRRDSTEQLDKDLFFAVLGGSPGNFGVLTSTTMRVLRDTDHPHSCGVKVAWLYNKDTLRELMQICNECSDDRTVPLDLNTSVLAFGGQHTPNFHPLSRATYDDEIAVKRPELTGTFGFNYVVPVVVFIAVWANLKGDAEPEVDATSRKWLERFLAVKGRRLKVEFDHTQKKTLSQLLRGFAIMNPREFTLPYVKRLYYAKSYALSQPDPQSGETLAEWVAERVDQLQSLWNLFENRGLRVAMQVGGMGGQPYNAPAGGVPMALGGRDATYMLGLNAFYDPQVSGAQERAKRFCDENDRVIFANKYNFHFRDPKTGRQLRALWGSFVHGNEVPNLDAQWRYYFDNEAVYKRLLAVKQAVDPKHVFTPNLFCIGASTSERFKDAPGARTGLLHDSLNASDAQSLRSNAGKKRLLPPSATTIPSPPTDGAPLTSLCAAASHNNTAPVRKTSRSEGVKQETQ